MRRELFLRQDVAAALHHSTRLVPGPSNCIHERFYRLASQLNETMVDSSGWEEPRAVIRVDAVKQIMPVRRCRSRVGWCRVFGWFQF